MDALPAAVDRLGKIKAQIAELEKEETSLRDTLVESGVDEVDGALFRVTVSRYQTEAVDWKAIAAALDPPAKLVTKHTTTKDRVTVKVVSR